MALGNKVGVKGYSWGRNQQRGKHSDKSDEEYLVGEEEDCEESDGYCSLDSDESEEEEALERVVGMRNFWTMSSNETKNPRKRRRVSYTVLDDDEDEFMSLGRKRNEIKKHQEKKSLSCIEEDEDFMSSSRKGNQIRKSRQNRISYTEVDDDDHETKEDQEEGEDSEFISGRKGNQTKKPWEKKRASYTEVDGEDDAEVMFSSRKQNQIKKPQEKVSVSCREEIDDDDDDDDVDDDDDDDEEFVLSDSDFVDEDNEQIKIMKNVKVSRYSLDKKNFRRRHNSRKHKFLIKPTKPKRRNPRLDRKIRSRDNQIPRKHLVKGRSKKISSQQKRRVKAESYSDFVSSVSSDHEYTISEEEREQMREAKVYCENLRSKLRNSSSRTQEEPTCERRKPMIGKGKEKEEDMKDEVGKRVCGICLSEEGKRTMRGILNCCRHHFCFSCILEWSKVESRCPLCKQRFSTITKAARSEIVFDSKTVVIPVPERDQIYQPSEEELRGYLDPYETVICTECHNSGDDAFMLLCDVCDSPAHTFCVGLGWEVPEGNWYCNGCTTPRLHTDASHLSSPISGSFDLNEVYVPEMPIIQETRFFPEPRLPPGDLVTVATTLRDRRRIHRQIHHQFLNDNRSSDLIARPSGTPASTSSTGIRLFGSS